MKSKKILRIFFLRFALILLLIGVISSYKDIGFISVLFSIILPIIFILNCVTSIFGLFTKNYFYLIGPIIFICLYSFFFQLSKIEDFDYDDSISILSYNVKGFKLATPSSLDKTTSKEIIKFIDSINPDILILQESAYKEGKKLKNYTHQFLGYRKDIKKTLLAIYSKYPIIDKGYIDFPDTRNNAIYADIKVRGDTLRIYNIHLQSFVINRREFYNKLNDFSYLNNLNNTITKQIEQAHLIKDHSRESNMNIIVSGDFNATPYSEPYRVLRKDLNDSYVSKGLGFGKTYSLFKYPLRLDYFLNDKRIRVLSHKNFNLNLSDHEPIYVKFKIKQPI